MLRRTLFVVAVLLNIAMLTGCEPGGILGNWGELGEAKSIGPYQCRVPKGFKRAQRQMSPVPGETLIAFELPMIGGMGPGMVFTYAPHHGNLGQGDWQIPTDTVIGGLRRKIKNFSHEQDAPTVINGLPMVRIQFRGDTVFKGKTYPVTAVAFLVLDSTNLLIAMGLDLEDNATASIPKLEKSLRTLCRPGYVLPPPDNGSPGNGSPGNGSDSSMPGSLAGRPSSPFGAGPSGPGSMAGNGYPGSSGPGSGYPGMGSGMSGPPGSSGPGSGYPGSSSGMGSGMSGYPGMGGPPSSSGPRSGYPGSRSGMGSGMRMGGYPGSGSSSSMARNGARRTGASQTGTTTGGLDLEATQQNEKVAKRAEELAVTAADSGNEDYYQANLELLQIGSDTHKSDVLERLASADPRDVDDATLRKELARALRDAAEDPQVSSNTRREAIPVLVKWTASYSVPILIGLLQDRQRSIQMAALEHLAILRDERAIEPVTELFVEDATIRDKAADCLRVFGPAAEAKVLELASPSDMIIARATVQLLGDIGTEKSLAPMSKLRKLRFYRMIKRDINEATTKIRDRTKKAE